MSLRRRMPMIGFVIGVTSLSISCEREQRPFRVQPPHAEAVQTVDLTTLHAGPTTGPATAPAVVAQRAVENAYEHNAWALAEGKRLYSAFNCNGCHGHGGGAMGPPLMDGQWIYGSEPVQVFATIVQGRPNGMPSYGGRIPNHQVWQLVAYVRSMSGLVRKDAAPGRSDQMKSSPPEHSMERQEPRQSDLPPPAEMPQ